MVSHIDYVYVNESIILPISFLAKPMPNIEGISWQVFSGDIIQIMQPGDVSYINYGISYLTAQYALSKHEAHLRVICFTFKFIQNQGLRIPLCDLVQLYSFLQSVRNFRF